MQVKSLSPEVHFTSDINNNKQLELKNKVIKAPKNEQRTKKNKIDEILSIIQDLHKKNKIRIQPNEECNPKTQPTNKSLLSNRQSLKLKDKENPLNKIKIGTNGKNS